MSERLSTPLGNDNYLELIDIGELSEEELQEAALDLSHVVNTRRELAVNYPGLPKAYFNDKTALKRLRLIRSIADDGFIPKLLVVTGGGLYKSAEGIATAMVGKPGMQQYETRRGTKTEPQLQRLYDLLSTNVTFWCAKSVEVFLEGHGCLDDTRFLQDPIAGKLVNSWGRELEDESGGVYTLLPQSRGVADAIDPSESLLRYGWGATEIRGVSELAGVPAVMEVVAPNYTNVF